MRLVLVHGSLATSGEWMGYDALLPECEVVAIDLPGHGSRLAEPFTTDGAVAAIAAAVGEDRPVVLAGHSLGGYMAQVFAVRHPGRLAGLALLGATGDPTSRLAAIYRWYAWLVDRVDHDRLARVRDAVARRLGVREIQLPSAEAYATLPATWQAVMDDCRPADLACVDAPVLFVNGQFDQMRLNERRYRRVRPDARLVVVPRASHLAPMSHPRPVARALGEFVARVA